MSENNDRQIVYVIHMLRWGDEENHSYVTSVCSTLKRALTKGLEHRDDRGGKYEPMIYMKYVDDEKRGNIICRDADEARKLLDEFDDKKTCSTD